MSVWLSPDELARTLPAETVGGASPVPTRVVSNGEYMPWAQTTAQRQVEHELDALAGACSRRLGMDRRPFLRTGCGMAAAFLAMNRVFGPPFPRHPARALDPPRGDQPRGDPAG